MICKCGVWTLLVIGIPFYCRGHTSQKYSITIEPGGASSSSGEQLAMRNAHGKLHDCLIPHASVLSPPELLPQNASQLPSELLQSLEGQCLSRQEDWWTYELCFGDFVRQMHLELGHLASEYLLGSYSAEDSALDDIAEAGSNVGHDAPHVEQIYSQGAACDTTGGKRSATVGYECGSGERAEITSVHEPASCTYYFTVAVPQLCQHPAFQAQPQSVGSIVCRPAAEGGREEEDRSEGTAKELATSEGLVESENEVLEEVHSQPGSGAGVQSRFRRHMQNVDAVADDAAHLEL